MEPAGAGEVGISSGLGDEPPGCSGLCFLPDILSFDSLSYPGALEIPSLVDVDKELAFLWSGVGQVNDRLLRVVQPVRFLPLFLGWLTGAGGYEKYQRSYACKNK
jgi:hypothetical protein